MCFTGSSSADSTSLDTVPSCQKHLLISFWHTSLIKLRCLKCARQFPSATFLQGACKALHDTQSMTETKHHRSPRLSDFHFNGAHLPLDGRSRVRSQHLRRNRKVLQLKRCLSRARTPAAAPALLPAGPRAPAPCGSCVVSLACMHARLPYVLLPHTVQSRRKSPC